MKNKDIAQKVVDRICDMIDEGKPLPWVQPWSRKPNTVTVVDGYKEITMYPTAWNRKGKLYKGANTYLPVGEYITFKQAKDEGGAVKKGVHGWPVVYWNFIEKKTTNTETGKVEKEVVPLLKYYTVFRVEDCEGIEQKHHPAPVTYKVQMTHEELVDTDEGELNDSAEAVINDYISRAGNGFKILRDDVTKRAFYSPAQDYVSVPCRAQYVETAEYYSTLFHELGHSTGHSTRLNRFVGKAAQASFGSEEYSREELVAESTAAAMLNALGMESGNSFRNSAAYIKSWSRVIKNDPLMYVTAATRAQAAFEMLMGIEKGDEEDV